MIKNIEYYDTRRETTYSYEQTVKNAQEHFYYPSLKTFIDDYEFWDKKCLEIGSARGLFQDTIIANILDKI